MAASFPPYLQQLTSLSEGEERNHCGLGAWLDGGRLVPYVGRSGASAAGSTAGRVPPVTGGPSGLERVVSAWGATNRDYVALIVTGIARPETWRASRGLAVVWDTLHSKLHGNLKL